MELWVELVFSELQRAKRALGDTIARVMATVTRSMHNNGNYCNTVNLEDAALYKGRLERFFMDLRADLQSPMLPIIQVALASGQGLYIEKVREAQSEIHLAHVKCVDAKGLQLEPDHLHLTTQTEVQLGKMLADAFLHTLPIPLQSNAPKTSHN
ncbi:probable carbohydrate esterase At4g34215 [Camellia sinensis]|uniref:probable carbohydrate esterase At4g34215 n=1 Tax=Camellia sinensis TaxID=4442 RepID=UPI0010367B93|nr:probable carbohydrate esterase At4g34215 [Camellia sinensis]